MCLDFTSKDLWGCLWDKQQSLGLSHEQCLGYSPSGPRVPTTLPSERPHLFCELDDQRQLVVLDEVQQLLLGDLTLKVVAAFIKLWTERRL